MDIRDWLLLTSSITAALLARDVIASVLTGVIAGAAYLFVRR